MSMSASYRMSIKVREQLWELILSTVRDSGTQLKSSGFKASVLLVTALLQLLLPYDDYSTGGVELFQLPWFGFFETESLYSPGCSGTHVCISGCPQTQGDLPG